MKKNSTLPIIKLLVIIVLSCVFACADLIEIDHPKTEITKGSVFATDASADAAMKGIYSMMMGNRSFTSGSIEEYTGIAADELASYSTTPNVMQFYQNTVTPQNNELGLFWGEAYRYINNANAILEGLEGPGQAVSVATKARLEGEAKFIRAFGHFYLVNLFGGIPYLVSTDYRRNAKAARHTTQEVFVQIESDLNDAAALLADDFSASGGERIQPNKGAALALLSRLYLFMEDWKMAEANATAIISNAQRYALAADLDDVFKPNSMETIWQLKPVIPGMNTPQGQLFILSGPRNGSSRRVSMTTDLVEAFEPGDLRAQKWVGVFTSSLGTWYYPFKYKAGPGNVLKEYSSVFRLAEQYLIRAEARAQLGDLQNARADLDAIRSRAGLENSSATTQQELLMAIEHERRIELFGEWGHRWIDLKRTGRADEILGPLKPDWQPTDKLFPIPESEILLNPALTQNSGY